MGKSKVHRTRQRICTRGRFFPAPLDAGKTECGLAPTWALWRLPIQNATLRTRAATLSDATGVVTTCTNLLTYIVGNFLQVSKQVRQNHQSSQPIHYPEAERTLGHTRPLKMLSLRVQQFRPALHPQTLRHHSRPLEAAVFTSAAVSGERKVQKPGWFGGQAVFPQRRIRTSRRRPDVHAWPRKIRC